MFNFSKETKGICTFGASILLHLLLGSTYTFANISLYVATYLKYTNYPEISIISSYFLLPIGILCSTFTAGIGGLLERKFGPRIAVSIGTSIIGFGYLSMYLTMNLYLLYLFVAFIGFGIGIAYMPPLRTLWKYYPEKKGFCSGTVLAAFGFSAMIFNKISDSLINPEGKSIDEKTLFYSKDIGMNVPKYYFASFLIIFICGFICIIFLFKFEDEIKGIPGYLSENLSSESDDLENIKVPQLEKEPINQAFKSKQFYLLCSMGFLYVFFPYMITNLIKPYGLLSISEESVRIILLIFPIANGSTRILWGFLCDWIGFKKVYLFMLCLSLICSSTISLVCNNSFLYTVYCCISISCLAGNYAVLPYVTSKVFGVKNSAEVYGIIFLSCGISAFIGPFVIKFVIGESKEKLLFHVVFWIGSAMQIICIFLCAIFEEKQFQYSKKNSSYYNEINSIDKEEIDE